MASWSLIWDKKWIPSALFVNYFDSSYLTSFPSKSIKGFVNIGNILGMKS